MPMHTRSDEQSQPTGRGRVRRALRWVWRVGLLLVLVAAVVIVYWFRTAFYNAFIRFPEEEANRASLRVMRVPVPPLTNWTEYRGVVHSHSEFSHDCEVSFPAILEALKETGSDFICMSDHCDNGKADFGRQWRGLREGKLFIPGFEMKEGLMPFGAASNIVLDNAWESDRIAQTALANGGVLFYAHPEEPRDWNRPELTGMEIYNTHADFKDEEQALLRILPDLLLNQKRHPDLVFRLMFDRPVENLRRWDDLNRTRTLTGIAGNDCHQNTGVRGISTPEGTLRIEDTSPRTLRDVRLNFLTRWLLRLFFGPLEPGRILCHVQIDPYARMARHVGTHVLARELTETAILDALRAGRAFVGFDMLADSAGCQWIAQGESGQAVMGETLDYTSDIRLVARSPLPCRFTVIRDGEPVLQKEGRSIEWTPPGPGKYRVEAELWIRGEWVAWVYANPIALR